MGGRTATVNFTNGDELYRSNYLGLFSGLEDGYHHTYRSDPGPIAERAMFGVNQGRKIRAILDGTSNTMVLAEYLTGTNKDNWRGAPFTTRSGAQMLFATLTPNSSARDRLWPTSGINETACENGTGFPGSNLPCENGNTSGNFASPRSRHPGGVHVLLCDGSARFVSDSVDLMGVWRPLATIADGQVLGKF